jgi:hypothetical protein
MQELQITWPRIISVWWLIVWRISIGSMIISVVINTFIYSIDAMLHLSTTSHIFISVIISLPIQAAWSIIVVRMAMKRKYGKFSLMLMSN